MKDAAEPAKFMQLLRGTGPFIAHQQPYSYCTYRTVGTMVLQGVP